MSEGEVGYGESYHGSEKKRDGEEERHAQDKERVCVYCSCAAYFLALTQVHLQPENQPTEQIVVVAVLSSATLGGSGARQ